MLVSEKTLREKGAKKELIDYVNKHFPDGVGSTELVNYLQTDKRDIYGYTKWLLVAFESIGNCKRWNEDGTLLYEYDYLFGVRLCETTSKIPVCKSSAEKKSSKTTNNVKIKGICESYEPCEYFVADDFNATDECFGECIHIDGDECLCMPAIYNKMKITLKEIRESVNDE